MTVWNADEAHLQDRPSSAGFAKTAQPSAQDERVTSLSPQPSSAATPLPLDRR